MFCGPILTDGCCNTKHPFVKIISHWYIYGARLWQDRLDLLPMWFGNSRYWLFQAIGWGGFTLISLLPIRLTSSTAGEM